MSQESIFKTLTIGKGDKGFTLDHQTMRKMFKALFEKDMDDLKAVFTSVLKKPDSWEYVVMEGFAGIEVGETDIKHIPAVHDVNIILANYLFLSDNLINDMRHNDTISIEQKQKCMHMNLKALRGEIERVFDNREGAYYSAVGHLISDMQKEYDDTRPDKMLESYGSGGDGSAGGNPFYHASSPTGQISNSQLIGTRRRRAGTGSGNPSDHITETLEECISLEMMNRLKKIQEYMENLDKTYQENKQQCIAEIDEIVPKMRTEHQNLVLGALSSEQQYNFLKGTKESVACYFSGLAMVNFFFWFVFLVLTLVNYVLEWIWFVISQIIFIVVPTIIVGLLLRIFRFKYLKKLWHNIRASSTKHQMKRKELGYSQRVRLQNIGGMTPM